MSALDTSTSAESVKVTITEAFPSRPLDEIRESADRPLVLLFHGRGGDESRFVPWIPQLPPEYDVIRFRGPLAYEDGYTWATPVTPGAATVPGVSYGDGAAAVEKWLDDNGLDTPDRDISVGGFSAGCILSFQLLERRPDRYTTVIGLSGCISPENAVSPGRADSPTRVFWGIDPVGDDFLTSDRLDATRTWLSRFDTVELHYPNTGHDIRAAEFADVVAFLKGSGSRP